MENGRLWIPSLLISFSFGGWLVPRRSVAEAAVVQYLYSFWYFVIGAGLIVTTAVIKRWSDGVPLKTILVPVVLWGVLAWIAALCWYKSFLKQFAPKEVRHPLHPPPCRCSGPHVAEGECCSHGAHAAHTWCAFSAKFCLLATT